MKERFMRISNEQIIYTPVDRGAYIKNKSESIKKDISSAESKNMLGDLINKKELMLLADKLKSGAINNQEARKSFIDLISKNAIDNNMSAKDIEEMVKDIDDFLSQDQDFLNSLINNLQIVS
jgi:hypothetical protein